MRKINIVLILIIAFDAIPCKNLASFATTIAAILSDDEKVWIDAVAKLNKNGSAIYINTPNIKVKTASTIKLSSSVEGGIFGNNNQVVLIQLLILNLPKIIAQLLEVSLSVV